MDASNSSCAVCTDIETKFLASEPNAFNVHIDVSIFHPGKNKYLKAQKKKKLQALEKIICALQNHLGGCVLVHLSGQRETDRYLGHFDDFIGPPFRALIQDGDLFVHTYSRGWQEIHKDHGSVSIIRINVKSTNYLCTCSFNTKVSTDFENTDATILNVLSILCKDFTSNAILPVPKIHGIKLPIQRFQENRSIELKLLPNDVQLSCSELVEFIWDDLKFKHNLTSMSKVLQGGSFYVGIREGKCANTVIPELEGFEIQGSEDDFQNALNIKLDTNVTVLTAYGQFIVDVLPLNLTNVAFHKLTGESPKIVIEIAVRYFEGIVFYDKLGPLSFNINDHDGSIFRMKKEEWFERLRVLL